MATSLDFSLGALEIGVLLSTCLYGVTTVQAYTYWSSRFRDPLWLRLLVASIWVLESFHTIFLWVYLYRLTVTYYGVSAVLASTTWSLDVSALFDGVIGATVQAYFAWRVHVVSQKYFIPVVSWCGSLLQLSAATAITILSTGTTIVYFDTHYEWLIAVNLALDLFVDLVNTSALCYHLWLGRNGMRHTDRVLDTLLMWTIETGLLTTVAAVMMLILSFAMAETALWITISMFYAKLYSNSLLASLNGRSSLRRTRHKDSANGVSTFPASGIAINVETAVEMQPLGSVDIKLQNRVHSTSSDEKHPSECGGKSFV
ncbi:hypothetical protein BJ138DRAFT_1144516 [Hygrophoropsis aurantiaca]|uniref:Uncharacterized protein n=1 Tax=Hygrophoropsis aurantiaca TaxID=72124 RepID=A0ACB8AMK1_9AGAM|nr:hypothetical protein BJ138DRAFT_1144516 [Hygrophoropsis aurantiaca]